MEVEEIIAKNLKEVRLELKLSQEEAASSIGQLPGTYGAWERGKNTIPLESIYAFCLVNKISLSRILPDYPVNDNNNSHPDSMQLLFDQLEKISNHTIASKLKDHYLRLFEEISDVKQKLINEKQKVIEEKEKREKLVELIEKKFNIKINH